MFKKVVFVLCISVLPAVAIASNDFKATRYTCNNLDSKITKTEREIKRSHAEVKSKHLKEKLRELKKERRICKRKKYSTS
ncbi:hypothetical protein [Psychromonas sp. Urea-02u-13]|uniref:hypothetical protein n=1 Tax=Psychromonas sp. Urea-02u-13 TaxID=2058326 RepID=UPI000C33929C|nr:hypothetical protein [Psychromonas sp. Urea-02u-13]PKG38284.1 hypothetical protein CXF74_14305 [Psychromonas sp. Urea-02u-13]